METLDFLCFFSIYEQSLTPIIFFYFYIGKTFRTYIFFLSCLMLNYKIRRFWVTMNGFYR